jgi:hypothetical protein
LEYEFFFEKDKKEVLREKGELELEELLRKLDSIVVRLK